MKHRTTSIALLAGAALLALTGCADGGVNLDSLTGGFKDLEGIPAEDPTNVRIFNNVDGFPNIVKVCTDGVAFATTTRDLNAVVRVPEWDGGCAK